jgi:hypothetical protein
MTANQIAYQANIEKARSNRANEVLQSRHIDEEHYKNIQTTVFGIVDYVVPHADAVIKSIASFFG